MNSTASRHFNTAVAAFQRGDFDTAVEHYHLGIEHQPDAFPAYLDLAKTYEQLGDWDAALTALDTALGLSPEHPVGLRRRTRILEEKETFDAIAARLTESSYAEFYGNFLLTVGAGISQETREIALKALASSYWELGRAFELFPTVQTVVHLLPVSAGVRSGYPLWAAGLASDGEEMVVFLRPDSVNVGVLSVLLRHEYAHLLVAQATDGNCPHWLNESIAQRLSKPMMGWEERQLRDSAALGKCLSLSGLEGSFTLLPQSRIALAYMQCGFIGRFLFEEFGLDAVRGILRELRQGTRIAEAFPTAFGLSVEEMESRLFPARESIAPVILTA